MKRELVLFFATLGVAVFLAGGLGELVLRIRYGSGALPKEIGGGYPAHLVMPDPRTGYTLTPGFRGRQLVPKQPEVQIKINRQGLRDYERTLPSSMEAIVAVGDSYTFGHSVPFEKIWPTLLENKIRETNPGYEVVKGGVPGFAWRQYDQQYQRLVQNLKHHPLVIVGFTVDAGERITKGYAARGGLLVRKDYPNLAVLDGLVFEKVSRHEGINRMDAFLRSRSYFFRWFNLRIFFLYHKLKKYVRQYLKGQPREEDSGKEKATLSSPPPIPEQRHIRHALAVLNSIYQLANSKGAKVLVLFIDYPNVWTEDIAHYEKIISQKGIPTLDLSKHEAASPSSWRIAGDGHWNAVANSEVAEIVYQFIREQKLLPALT